jgi:hypothetical protein
MVRRLIRSAPLAGALLFPCLTLAAEPDFPGPDALTLRPAVAEPSGAASGDDQAGRETRASGDADAADRPLYLADAAEEKPNIHGFFSSPFKTSYVTPRGLVVENSGVVWQPVGGLIIPIGDIGPVKNFAVIGGIWNSVNTAQGDPKVGPWNEMDVFVSLSGDIDKFNLTLTYGAWNFPQSTVNKPSTEHNIDLKVVYNDSDLWGGKFALKPYVDFFYAVAGSSTVVLGKTGSTGYVELGIAPTWTWKGVSDYPVTFTFPIYTSVGPAGYWDTTESSGNWGLFSAAVNASVPLSFIPTRYGYWHLDAGVTYYYLINDALLQAGNILSGNDNRNVIQGSLGVGVNF